VLMLDLVWLLCVMCGYAKDRADCKRKNVAVHAFYPPVADFLSGLQGLVRILDFKILDLTI
jgi:hypothetical protein